MLLRLLLTVAVFIGMMAILAVAFAMFKVNAAFAVSGHHITNQMVIYAIAGLLALLTFKRVQA